MKLIVYSIFSARKKRSSLLSGIYFYYKTEKLWDGSRKRIYAV